MFAPIVIGSIVSVVVLFMGTIVAFAFRISERLTDKRRRSDLSR